MRRITLHWTGGNVYPSPYEKTRYPFLIDHNGVVHEGVRPPEANKSPLGPHYYRHCGGLNSDNIGVALCGMADAQERPFFAGPSPITMKAYSAAIELFADLCETYGIKVSPRTVFLHSEVRPRWGVGRYKWDVNWLPGMKEPGDPIQMGNAFRQRVAWELRERQRDYPDWWTRRLGFCDERGRGGSHT